MAGRSNFLSRNFLTARQNLRYNGRAIMRVFPFLLVVFSVFFAPVRADNSAPISKTQTSLENPRAQKPALQLARLALEHFFKTGKILATPTQIPSELKIRAGVIATIEKKGQVQPRGCRGTLQPQYSDLASEIIANIIAAATRDKRVQPLQKSEMSACRISLTIILDLQPIQNLSQHDVENCGLIAQSGGRIGLVLPYEGRDAQTQWKWARQKAGLKDSEKAQMLEVRAVRFRE